MAALQWVVNLHMLPKRLFSGERTITVIKCSTQSLQATVMPTSFDRHQDTIR